MISALVGTCRHGFWIKMKPFNGLESRCVNGDVLHPSNKVERVAAMLAFTETVPDVFTDAHPELRRIAAFVDRTRPTQAVSAPFEPVQETVVLQHLLHGDGRFHGLEVNER